ncbi:TRIM4 ligase, partial [Ciccaba nigrolineata]|nr:TRIM4 ligase [Ciccaba nigrolineata]
APCSAARSLQDELTCPVCLEYFNDPVLVAECGHNFCRACVTQSEPPPGPPAPAPPLPAAAPPGPPGPPRCPRHGEPLRLYCVQDRRAVCVVCHLSREHRTHTVLPAEEAAHAAEEVPQEHLSSLKKGREEAKAERERQSEDLL